MRTATRTQLGAALVGNFDKEVALGRKHTERAITAAMFEFGDEVQQAWRTDIEASRLANPTALRKTIRTRRYPNKGLNPAVVVWSKFPVIQRAFEQSVTIKGKDGLWLAIPTEAAGKTAFRDGYAPDMRGKGGKRQRITPGGFERRSGLKLRFVYRRNGPSLLVVDGAQLDRRRGGKAIAYRGKGQGSKLYGPSGQTIVVFILVKQVRTPRLLRGTEIRARAARNGPGRVQALFVKHFERDGAAPLALAGPGE